jgi:hypothetical protein
MIHGRFAAAGPDADDTGACSDRKDGPTLHAHGDSFLRNDFQRNTDGLVPDEAASVHPLRIGSLRTIGPTKLLAGHARAAA